MNLWPMQRRPEFSLGEIHQRGGAERRSPKAIAHDFLLESSSRRYIQNTALRAAATAQAPVFALAAAKVSRDQRQKRRGVEQPQPNSRLQPTRRRSLVRG